MTAFISPPPKLQFFTNAGVPMASGLLYTYAAGTTTPLVTYTDSTGLVANTNPVILDSRGEASIWLGGVGYKFKLATPANVDVWTQDNITAYQVSSNLISYTPAGTGAVVTTVQAKLRESVSVKDFGAVGDGVTDDTAAFNAAVTAAAGNPVYVPTATYNLASAVSSATTPLWLANGANIPKQYNITGEIVNLSDRDWEAMMGMGYFNIWLTGNTFSNPTTNSFVATNWRVLYDGTAGTFVVDQAGGPFSIGASNGLRWNQTVAGAGDTYRTVEYRIEDASTYNAGKATLSFFLTGGTSFNVTTEIVQFFGTGGSPSADVVCGTTTFAVTASTKRFSLTVDMPSTAAKTFGTNINDCVKIKMYFPINAVFNCVLNEVVFERGPIRTPFMAVPLSVQHEYIARYLQYSAVSIGFNATGAGQYMYGPISFKSVMRTTPIIAWANLAGAVTANLDASLAGRPAYNYMQNYCGTVYIFSAAAGVCYALGQQIQLDARL